MVITITPRSDCFVDEANPTTSYTTSSPLENESHDASDNKRSFIEFSLDDLPRPFCNIVSITLYLRVVEATSSGQTPLDFNWLQDYEWDPGDVTWNDQLNTGSTDFSKTISDVGIISEDVTNYISYLNILYSYIGYQTKYSTENATDSLIVEIASMESGILNWRPYISVINGDWMTQITSDVIIYDPGWELPPWWKGHAKEVYYTDHDVGYSEFELKVLFPWNDFGDAHTTISALPYQTWSSTYSNGDLRWRVYIYFATSEPPSTIRIYEQFWTIGDLYVKTTGDDSFDGRNWSNAFKTIDRAANVAVDGQEVHIGFGTYDNEPANNDITPVNFAGMGIKYTPETVDTGGGTGSVIIEKN